MVQVLILAENVANELPLYENLRKLNYEVLISDKILTEFRQNHSIKKWLSLFSVLVLSETICDKEADDIAGLTDKYQNICLRKYDSELENDEREKFAHFDDWFSTDASLSELREIFFHARERENFSKIEKNRQKMSTLNRIDLFLEKLPPISRKIFNSLEEENGGIISREDLALKVWGEITHSTLSQLSNRICAIRKFISEDFGYENAIVTDWRKGYSFSNSFYQDILQKNREPIF